VHVFGRGQSATRQDIARAEFVESMDHFRQAATHAAGGLGATVGPKVGLGMGIARDKMGSARGFVGTARAYVVPGSAKMTRAASRGWDTTIAFVMPLADAARAGSTRATIPEGIKLPPGVKMQAIKAQAVKAQAMRTHAMKKKTPPSTSSGHTATAMASIVAAGAALGATGALVARRRNRSKWAEYEPAALRDDAQAFVDPSRSSGPGAASKMAGWAKEHSRSAVDGVRGKMHGSSATSAGTSMDEMTSRPGRMGDDMAEPMPGKASDAAERAGDSAHHMADKAEAKLNDAATRRGAKPSPKSTDAGDNADDTVPNTMPPNKDGRQQQ
jgi:hypothetical protein